MAEKKKSLITHPEKIYWPAEKYTKGDVAAYYEKMAPFILPYLKNRPLSLNRFPEGIKGPHFYQKDAGDHVPEWIKTVSVHAESTGKDVRYIVCNNLKTLLYVTNLGSIEMNPWNSTVAHPDQPDYVVLDIDPSDKNSFDQVIEVARAIKDLLDDIGASGYCKTSGSSGLHVYIPCNHRYAYQDAREFAHMLAQSVQERLPGFTTLERSLAKRKNTQVYLDYLQNSRGQTLASAYSVRPKPGATVSAPLDWKEVKAGLHPSQFTIRNMVKRVERKGDLFKPVLGKGLSIPAALKRMEKLQLTLS